MATITINIDPMFHVGPLMQTWHGLMIAVGIVAGGWLAMRYAEELELSRDTVFNLIALLALAGIVGSRLLYLILNDAAALLRPDQWLGSRGFAFYGALIVGPAAVAVYLWRTRLSLRYLDALAAGFPLGMAVGRIGDVISGEHYGPPTTLPWAFAT
ncbi:MAG: prolipoprotein diacylglyceryl transferase family protein [Actinomycetota bacterium]